MLNYISVKNIAVIEKASLDLEPGLNIITGETGAGKSVLIGALKYLTGDRTSKITPRKEGDKFSAEAIFSDFSHVDPDLIEQYDIEEDLIISRVTDENGKSKSFINSKVTPVNVLREVSEYLIDIHGQHENQFLFNPSKHLSFVDFFIKEKFIKDFQDAYKEYKQNYNELKSIKENKENTLQLQDMYKFQISEINNLNINIEQDKDIEERIKLLSNTEKLKDVVISCREYINGNEISAIELIEKALKSLSNITSLSQNASKAEELFGVALSNLEDGLGYVESILDSVDDFSENDINYLIDRKFKLVELMKKYGGSLQEVINHRDKTVKELELISLDDDAILKKEEKVKYLKGIAIKFADILNKEREKVAADITSKTEKILKELELPNSKFKVEFKKLDEIDSHGGVTAEFNISTNAGFKPAPLAQVASGGEISRVMLALKEVFADFDDVSTMIFDEIDTGISGKAAKSVAEKLKKLSAKKQIIVITHLPVVAAMGNCHFHISKNIVDGVSSTSITKLDSNDKEKMIATMIAGEVTDASIAQAKDLLNKNN